MLSLLKIILIILFVILLNLFPLFIYSTFKQNWLNRICNKILGIWIELFIIDLLMFKFILNVVGFKLFFINLITILITMTIYIKILSEILDKQTSVEEISN